MTELLAEVDHYRSSRRLDPLSAHLRLVQDLTGRDVLLESCDGEIVAYALRSHVSSTICAAVLTRSARPLRSALRESRKVALATAGPVRTALVDGQTATVVPVAAGDGAGRLWLLGADATDLDAPLQAMIEELGGLATRLSQVEDVDVSDIIAGEQPVPPALVTCTTFLLVASADMPAGIAVERLRQAARDMSTRLLFYVGVHQGADVALICCNEQLTIEALTAMISDWAVPYGIRCVLTPWHADGSGAAFDEAQSVLRAAPIGCSVPSQMRSPLFVELMCEAVNGLDILGDDPVASLIVGYPDFARALLAWLDTHGDVVAAATAMTCHVNTLRYRIRRAGELLPGNLHDPAFRLEVHLRLMTALREDKRPDVASGLTLP